MRSSRTRFRISRANGCCHRAGWSVVSGRRPPACSTSRPSPCSGACGFAYLVYVGEYLAVAMFLFFGHRERILRKFALAFLIVNLLGFVTYFVYPVAPPWYVSEYGLGPARMDVHSFAAGASRFDQI